MLGAIILPSAKKSKIQYDNIGRYLQTQVQTEDQISNMIL